MSKKPHHFHLSVCHGWWILPRGGDRGYGGGDFGCGAEVALPHLIEKQKKGHRCCTFVSLQRNSLRSATTAPPHRVRSHWGRPGHPIQRRRPSHWAPGRCGDGGSVCGGLPFPRRRRPARPRPQAGSKGCCPGPSALHGPTTGKNGWILGDHKTGPWKCMSSSMQNTVGSD